MIRLDSHAPARQARQQGAALVVVMVVLTSALILGVMGLQSALVDQRLAANYRAALKAQMRTESAAAEALAALDTLKWENAFILAPDQPPRWRNVSNHASAVHHCLERSCLYIPVIRHNEPWILALGVVSTGEDAEAPLAAHSEAVFVRVEVQPESSAQPRATLLWD